MGVECTDPNGKMCQLTITVNLKKSLGDICAYSTAEETYGIIQKQNASDLNCSKIQRNWF